MNVLPFPQGLVVSCQALPDEPLHGPEIMARMAQAAAMGGAVAIRANTPEDIRAIRSAIALPVIGLFKVYYPDSPIYITPTLREVDAILSTGAAMISVDATHRVRPAGSRLPDLVAHIHASRALALADVSTLAEAINAERLGFDAVATTLSGYTAATINRPRPDFELVADCVRELTVPVLAEGHVNTPADLVACLARGAYAVVVGTAITRPQAITRRFVNAFETWHRRLAAEFS